jgi:hypothetical protein
MFAMSPETISFLEIFGLSLLAFMGGLLLLALGAFVLVRYWQKRTQNDLELIRKQLRELTSHSKALNTISQDYTPSDPEPFGSLAAELVRQQNELDGQLQQLHKFYAGIQGDIRNIHAEEWVNKIRLPYDWYRMRQKLQGLQKIQVQVEHILAAAAKTVETIKGQGWEVAMETRQVLAENQAVVSILTGLHSSDIRDPDLDTSLADAKECEAWLSTQIPVHYLSGDQSKVLAETDKESISQVYKMLAQARPGVEELMTRAKSWESQYAALKAAISELVSGFRELSPEFSELESNPVNPLEWDQSRQVLAGLRLQIEGLSTGNQTRTIEQISNDLETARELSARQSQLASHCRQIKKQYYELLELIDNSEIRQGEAWIRRAQKTVEQMQEYNPENWDRTDAVDKLANDLTLLAERQSAIGISDPSDPVLESRLPQLLEQTQALGVLHQGLRQRTASAHARHGEIKEAERSSRDTLSAARALLNQAASLAASNPHLSKTATSEIKQLRESVEQMLAEFDRPEEGIVDKKAQKSVALLKKIEGAADRWLEQISQNLNEKITSLDKKAALLRDIAQLDEPAMLESMKILSQVSLVNLSKRGQSRSLTLPEMIAEMKKRNEEWQLSIAASRALDDIQGPILERFTQADQQRSQASQWLNRAVTLIPESRSWPATTQLLTSERQQFDALDEQWHSLRDRPIKAIDLVSKLSDLNGKYQALAAKLKQTVETAQQDQNRIRELEARFAESCQLWRDQMQEYSDNLLTRESISKLLADAESELEAIRQRYQRDGLPYHQILQQLRSLCQKIDSAEAAYDENHVIDINGEMQVLY